MSEGLNRVMLLGNLGADPELRYTSNGQAVLSMRIATTESYLDKDKQRQERTEWHNVVVWGKRGEALARFLSKGSRVFIEGGLRTSSYEDKEGNKRWKTEIVASNVVLDGKRDGAGGEQREARPAQPPTRGAQRMADETVPQRHHGALDANDYGDDDIPF